MFFPANRACHSNVGKWGSMESMRGDSSSKTIKDGLNRYRSHAFAHLPYAGMTYLLKP